MPAPVQKAPARSPLVFARFSPLLSPTPSQLLHKPPEHHIRSFSVADTVPATRLHLLSNDLFPQHFEDFVAGHFRSKGRTILVSCRAYIQGAQVGCVVGNGVQDVDEGDKSSSSTFKENLRTIYEQLVMEFTAKGAGTDMLSTQ